MKEFAALQDMTQMPVMERLTNSLMVTALGMGITFIVLVLLLYAIKVMSALLNPDKPPTELVEEKPVVKEEPALVLEEDEGELVAVLIAAIATSSGQGYEQIRIRGFREITNGIPIWSQAGVLETMNREI